MRDFQKRIIVDLSTSVEDGARCVTCKWPILEFRDELSVKEYHISGMCQKCQDEVFDERVWNSR